MVCLVFVACLHDKWWMWSNMNVFKQKYSVLVSLILYPLVQTRFIHMLYRREHNCGNLLKRTHAIDWMNEWVIEIFIIHTRICFLLLALSLSLSACFALCQKKKKRKSAATQNSEKWPDDAWKARFCFSNGFEYSICMCNVHIWGTSGGDVYESPLIWPPKALSRPNWLQSRMLLLLGLPVACAFLVRHCAFLRRH